MKQSLFPKQADGSISPEDYNKLITHLRNELPGVEFSVVMHNGYPDRIVILEGLDPETCKTPLGRYFLDLAQRQSDTQQAASCNINP